MLHLLDSIDDDFLAQIEDVIVGHSRPEKPKSVEPSGEAIDVAATHEEPVPRQLLSSTQSQKPVDGRLVGTPTTELESGEDIGRCQGLNFFESGQNQVIFGAATATPAFEFESPRAHLLDHVYACPEPASFEDVNFGDDDEAESNDFDNRKTDDDFIPLDNDFLLQNDEPTYIPEVPTKNIFKARKKRKMSESSSALTTSGVATTDADSAYDSPSPAYQPSSPPASPALRSPTLSPRTSASSRRSSQNLSPDRSSASASSSSNPPTPVTTPSHFRKISASKDSYSTFGGVDEKYSSFTAPKENDLTNDWGSTLDFDLLDSLLSKDILNDMGQIILNDVESKKLKEEVEDISEVGVDGHVGVDGFEDEFFSSLFGKDVEEDHDDANLVNDVSSDDWESTFNELFPQLCS